MLGCTSLQSQDDSSTIKSINASQTGLIRPAPLQPGDTIMFIAPAGELDEVRMNRAKDRLEARGYRVIQRDDLFEKWGYLAGSDERRAEELMQAFTNPKVKAIFPGTGGYGTSRILDLIDYDVIRANPKILIGFSDITGLHLAINRNAGLVTYHSPNPMWGLGSVSYMTPFSEEYFFKAIEAPSPNNSSSNSLSNSSELDLDTGYDIIIPEDVPNSIPLNGSKASGRLVGGNLSLISSLIGTPGEIDTTDAVLYVEDVREAPYRMDRMLMQLKLAGKLDTLKAAVLGKFTRVEAREQSNTRDPEFSVNGVLRQYFEPLGIPVLMNYPAGHYQHNATLPLGAMVEVDADNNVLRILESPTAPSSPE